MRFTHMHCPITEDVVIIALAMHMYVWNLGSQKKSWFQNVSDGFCFGWSWHVLSICICRTGHAACPDLVL